MSNLLNKKPLFVILCIIFLFIIIYSGVSFYQFVEGPESCRSCHEMKFYESYKKPENDSIIAVHELNCLGCHTNRSLHESRDAILKKLLLIKLLSLKTNSSEINATLKPDCKRCHIMDDPDHIGTKNCDKCHWAHAAPQGTAKVIRANMIFEGAHKNISCFECHGTNFEIPSCTGCHKGHSEEKWDNDLCLNCHFDAHVPGKPGFPLNGADAFRGRLSMETCKPCHENEYLIAKYSSSKHSNNDTCIECHPVHRLKPQCDGKCHSVMGFRREHPEYRCENCHLADPRKVTCFDCHGREVHDLSATNAFWNPK